MPLLGVVHLTKGQPDWKADQMSSWPTVVPLLTTRCLYKGVCLTKGQPDWKADQMSSWPAVVPLLTTRCLYLGFVWPKVSLTKDLRKNVNLTKTSSMEGSIWLKCKKDIWKFEHTLHFRSCFTEVFSMKDQKEICLQNNEYISCHWSKGQKYVCQTRNT